MSRISLSLLSRAPRRPSRQGGVVLIVALVMLVIIGLGSVAVMRNVMGNDLVSENNRRHAQAMQAAQAALRYCEQAVAASNMTPVVAVSAGTPEAWTTFATWHSSGKMVNNSMASGGPVVLTADYMNGSSSQSHRYDDDRAPRPQCMAQSRSMGSGQPVIVITARGFSDNYVARSDGNTETGAVVWLQSIIQL